MSIYDFKFKTIDGEDATMDQFKDKVGRFESTTEPMDIEEYIKNLL